jgi:hypothetical protein
MMADLHSPADHVQRVGGRLRDQSREASEGEHHEDGEPVMGVALGQGPSSIPEPTHVITEGGMAWDYL